MSIIPPSYLRDYRTDSQIASDARLADEFAEKGTVKHFALRLGFMPHNEEAAEQILERIVREFEWYKAELERLYNGTI